MGDGETVRARSGVVTKDSYVSRMVVEHILNTNGLYRPNSLDYCWIVTNRERR